MCTGRSRARWGGGGSALRSWTGSKREIKQRGQGGREVAGGDSQLLPRSVPNKPPVAFLAAAWTLTQVTGARGAQRRKGRPGRDPQAAGRRQGAFPHPQEPGQGPCLLAAHSPGQESEARPGGSPGTGQAEAPARRLPAPGPGPRRRRRAEEKSRRPPEEEARPGAAGSRSHGDGGRQRTRGARAAGAAAAPAGQRPPPRPRGPGAAGQPRPPGGLGPVACAPDLSFRVWTAGPGPRSSCNVSLGLTALSAHLLLLLLRQK